MTDYTVTFTYDELDAIRVALSAYQFDIIQERKNDTESRPERDKRAAEVLGSIETAREKVANSQNSRNRVTLRY